MTYPEPGEGDKFGRMVKVNQDYMGVLSRETNGFDKFGSFQENPSLHLHKRQEDGSWARFGAPFYLYPFYDSDNNLDADWQIKNFAIVKENLFIIACINSGDQCTLRHFYNDGTSWRLILADPFLGTYKNYIYPGVDDMDELSMFGYNDYLIVGCGETQTTINLDCYSMTLWKRDPENFEFQQHQVITGPGEFDSLLGVQDMSADGQWLVTYGSPGNDVFRNVGGVWSYHSRIPDLNGITIDNGRLVGADRTTDTLETYVLESNVWTKKPLMSIAAGRDVTTSWYPEFKLSVNKLYLLNEGTRTIKVYEAGQSIWTEIQDISQLGPYQSDRFIGYLVGYHETTLRRFSATEFAIAVPSFDNDKGMVLFMEDGTAYPTVSPTDAPSVAPTTAAPTQTGETPVPTDAPTTAAPTDHQSAASPVAASEVECAEDGVSSGVVAGAAAGAGVGGALLGATTTYFLIARRSAPSVVAGRAMMDF